MNHETMLACVNRYIDNTKGEKEQKLVRKLLLDGQVNFCCEWVDLQGDTHAAVANTIRAYEGDKGKAVLRMKSFVAWLERATGHKANVNWPPIDISNRFERLIFIMRLIHDKPANLVEAVQDELWISERTIEGDLSAIQYDDSVENSFLSQSFRVNGLKRAGGMMHFMSTVHPVLLMENLTSIGVMLQALLEKAEEPLCCEWATTSAGHIWHQLTPYAQAKVASLMERSFTKGSSAFKRFEQLKDNAYAGEFVPEREVTDNPLSQLMYSFKSGESCQVRAIVDGQQTTYTGTVTNYTSEYIGMTLDDGNHVRIPIDRIIDNVPN